MLSWDLFFYLFLFLFFTFFCFVFYRFCFFTFFLPFFFLLFFLLFFCIAVECPSVRSSQCSGCLLKLLWFLLFRSARPPLGTKPNSSESCRRNPLIWPKQLANWKHSMYQTVVAMALAWPELWVVLTKGVVAVKGSWELPPVQNIFMMWTFWVIWMLGFWGLRKKGGLGVLWRIV